MTARGSVEEAAAPKYAQIERERRWLVDPTRCPLPLEFVLIEDRYIDTTRLRLRRMTDSMNGKTVLKLTKKYEGGDPMARPIVTAYLTDAEFAVFEKLEARRLVKRRYRVGMFTIDAFEGELAPLMIAEIEQPCDASLRAVAPPPWAVREVTGEATFECGNLV